MGNLYRRESIGKGVLLGNADGDTDVDAADLAAWKSQFASGGASGPGVLQTGFVRYVTGAAAAVPEPSTVVLVGLGFAAVALAPRKRNRG